MSSPRRKLFAVVLAFSVLATLLAGLRTVLTPDYAQAEPTDRVVIVGVPSLDWEVITPSAMPNLWQLSEEGAVGLITARAARSVTCPWDGWLTLGAGNRARYPATIPEDELPPEPGDPLPGEQPIVEEPSPEPATPEEERQEAATKDCLGQRGAVPTVGGSQMAPAILENDRLTFGAEPGALGAAVTCSTVVGGAPVLAVGAEGADVRSVPGGTNQDEWAYLMQQCPLTLIATGHALDRTPLELQALDAALGEIVQGAKKQGATVIIAGTSQPEYKRARLHALIVVNPGMQQQVLSSPSTSRAPFSQLIDLAPTALAILDETAPASMAGQVLRGQERTGTLEQTTEQFYGESVAAVTHIWLSGKFFVFMAWVTALGALLLAGLIHLRRSGHPITRGVGTVIGLLPAASLAANLYPWWTAPRPVVAVLAAITVSWIMLSVIALWGPWRRYRSGPLIAVCLITFAVLATDVLTGSHLQLNSPLGYNPIVAGRFTGFGNMPFAMFGAAALVLVAVACKLVDGRKARTVLVVASGIALIAMVGAPGAGTDFGGVVSLVPSLMLLWLVVTGTRLSIWRTVLLLGSGVLVVMAIAVLDYLRPAADRTHLGRFVGQILDGTAITIVQRKLEANLRILTGSVLTLMTIVLVAIVLWQWLSRRSAGHQYVQERAPYAAAAVVSVCSVALVGFAVNDSGIAITAAALAVVVPPLLGSIGGPEQRWVIANEVEPSAVRSSAGT